MLFVLICLCFYRNFVLAVSLGDFALCGERRGLCPDFKISDFKIDPTATFEKVDETFIFYDENRRTQEEVYGGFHWG